MNRAVAFEYEWMADGAIRLRFLDRQDGILGQQIVAAEAMQPLQILIGLAVAKASPVDTGKLLTALRRHLNVNLETAEAVVESVRVRSGVTPDGNISLEAVE